MNHEFEPTELDDMAATQLHAIEILISPVTDAELEEAKSHLLSEVKLRDQPLPSSAEEEGSELKRGLDVVLMDIPGILVETINENRAYRKLSLIQEQDRHNREERSRHDRRNARMTPEEAKRVTLNRLLALLIVSDVLRDRYDPDDQFWQRVADRLPDRPGVKY